MLEKLGDDGLNSCCRFFRFLHATCVVGADHNDGDFGLKLGEFTVLKTPKYLLGSITRKSDIKGLPRSVVFLPDVFPGFFPIVGDGVTDEEKIAFFTLSGSDFSLVALFPKSCVDSFRGSGRGVYYCNIGLSCRCGRSLSKKGRDQ